MIDTSAIKDIVDFTNSVSIDTCFVQFIKIVGANGDTAKSRRFAVRVKLPGSPTYGRAMIRPRRAGRSRVIERAYSQIRYNSSKGMMSSGGNLQNRVS